MAVTIFSDPHLGKSLVQHTTAASRVLHQLKLTDQVRRILNHDAGARQGGVETPPIVCLGDLFDKVDAPAHALQDAIRLVRRPEFSACIAGNHDIPNRQGVVSSYDVLRTVCEDEGHLFHPIGPHDRFVVDSGNTSLFLVPHFPAQEQFVDMCRYQAGEAARRCLPGKVKALGLHCNFDIQFDSVKNNDSVLNLTREVAEELLKTFDYIFIGHDHRPRTELNGRVIIVGNTMPTCFGDISDKFTWTLTDEGTVEPTCIWFKPNGYCECVVDESGVLRVETGLLDAAQFIRITGRVAMAGIGKVTSEVKRLWEESDNLIAVRMDEIEILTEENKVVKPTTEFVSLFDRVNAELAEEPEMLALWREVSAEG